MIELAQFLLFNSFAIPARVPLKKRRNWQFPPHVGEFPIPTFFESIHLKLYNDNPFWRRDRDSEFPTRHSRYISIPHLWSSSCGGRRIPPRLLDHGVGNWDVPFVTRGEFIIPTTHGFATRGRNYPVPFSSPEGINPIPLLSEIRELGNQPWSLINQTFKNHPKTCDF